MRADGTDAMGKISPLHIVVTGAAGYLGRRVVAAARDRGHRVTEITRNAGHGIAQDLAKPDAEARLISDIQTADAVIHAASEMTGDWQVHERSTLPATHTICALANALNAHLVHISSIAIYDYGNIPAGTSITELSPVETSPDLRDGYARAKLAQEQIITQHTPQASVLRVGAIFGKTRIMNAHLGIGLGPILLRLASRGQIPLAHVDLVAHVAVQAAENKVTGAVNVIDTDLPDRIRFISALSQSGWPKLVIPLPWKIFSALGSVLSFWRSRPGLLHRKTLHARMKPLAYDNSLMRAQFDEQNELSFETLMKQAMRDD